MIPVGDEGLSGLCVGSTHDRLKICRTGLTSVCSPRPLLLLLVIYIVFYLFIIITIVFVKEGSIFFQTPFSTYSGTIYSIHRVHVATNSGGVFAVLKIKRNCFAFYKISEKLTAQTGQKTATEALIPLTRTLISYTCAYTSTHTSL